MSDDAFAFIQAMFHVVLFMVIHGRRARQIKNCKSKSQKVFNP